MNATPESKVTSQKLIENRGDRHARSVLADGRDALTQLLREIVKIDEVPGV